MFTNSGPVYYTLARNISGTGDLIASTTGYTNRIRLSPLASVAPNSNTWVGNLIITNGGVQITDGSSNAIVNRDVIPDTSDVIMAANTVLGFGATETFGALNGAVGAIVGEDFPTNGTALNMTLGANDHDGVFNGTIWLHALGTNANANMPLQITKIGSGSQTFNGTCSNTAPTYVGDGSLVINGNFASTNITVSNNATLGGSGTLAGAVTVQANATLAPGTSLVGTLTINSNLTLAGNLSVNVDKSLAPANSSVAVTGTLNNTGTGTVTMNNLNGTMPFAGGDKFTLFSQPLANGDALTISPSSPGANLAWVNNLAVDGSIAVASTLPTSITTSVSGSTLTVSWPADHLGWRLVCQTNDLSTGLSGNWVTVPGSTSTTSLPIQIDPANPTVFYKLVLP
jgi:hypothetical protein